jgi:D-amino peptidase
VLAKEDTVRGGPKVKFFLSLFLFAAVAGAAPKSKLKVYISVDLEGVSGIVNSEQIHSGGEDYALGRKWAAEDTNAAIEGALAAGATEIVVNDAHGSNNNLIASDLHPKARLISGAPKPFGMMQGIDDTYDAALFIGYHARAGTANALLDHTNTSSVFSLKVNDLDMPELGINALVAGVHGVPIVMVSGDDATADQSRELLGNELRTAVVKEAIGRTSAKLFPFVEAREKIRAAAEEGVSKRKDIPSYRLKAPYTFSLTYSSSSKAEIAMLIPNLIKRTSARTVEFSLDNYLDAFRLYRALLYLGDG